MQYPSKFLYFLNKVIPSPIQRQQVIKWLALAYQKKMKPRTALWFWGPSASGKSTLAKLFNNILNDAPINGEDNPFIITPLTDFYEKNYAHFEGEDWEKIKNLLNDTVQHKRPYQNSIEVECHIHPVNVSYRQSPQSPLVQGIRFDKINARNPLILEDLKTEIPIIRQFLLTKHYFQQGDIGYILGATPVLILETPPTTRYCRILYLRDSEAFLKGRGHHAYIRGQEGRAKSITVKPRDPKFTITAEEKAYANRFRLQFEPGESYDQSHS